MTTRERLVGWDLARARLRVNPGSDWPRTDRSISPPPSPETCDHRYQTRETDVFPWGSRKVWYCARCGQVQP